MTLFARYFRIPARGWFPRLVLPLLVLCSSGAAAETLYVTDILRLGLHNQPDTSDRPFRVLVSGDTLEVLERTPYYANVRLLDGIEGWVKLSYLVAEKPAQTQLGDLTRARDRLASEVTSLQMRLTDQDEELVSLRSGQVDLERNAITVANELAALRTTNETLGQQVAANRLSVHVKWLLVIAAAMLVGGFIAGWWWTDMRQRARHGGFRI